MAIKLFDKFSKEIFWGLIVIESISFWLWLYPDFSIFAWVLAVLLTLVLSIKRIEWGLYIIFLELFIGSQGHIIDLSFGSYLISLRIGLFIAVFVAMIYHLFRVRKSFSFNKINYYILSLIIFLFLAIVQGFVYFGFVKSFFDFNGYLFLALWPSIYLIKADNFLLQIFKMLLVAVNWVFIKTFVLLFIFAHNISWLDLSTVYSWIRDQRFGEITYVTQNFYRIFLQSQIYAVVLLLILIVIWFSKYWKKYDRVDKRWLFISVVTSSLTIIASFSRSYWVGLVGTIIILAVYLLWQRKINLRNLSYTIFILLVLLAFDIGFLFFWTGSWQPSIVGNRLSSTEEAAANSRQAQLKPLYDTILLKPYLGHGFGKEVTYFSSDPRIKNEDNPTGKYSTYAFEWGYLDIWLKMGLFGLLTYLAVISRNLYKSLQNSSFLEENNILKLGISFGMIAILIISMFSPYMNHPLGIAWLLITFYND